MQIASNLVKVLNDKASVHEAEFGQISIEDVLGAPSVKTAIDCTDPDCTDSSHSHSHEHVGHSTTDDHHSHSHDHEASACTDPDCTDSSHSHDHSHHHEASACTDPTHDHSHSHDHGDCNDPTHDHSHDYNTHVDNLGITSFVYRSDRPFNAIRLMAVLHTWPIPVKDELDLGLLKEASDNGVEIDGETRKSPFVVSKINDHPLEIHSYLTKTFLVLQLFGLGCPKE